MAFDVSTLSDYIDEQSTEFHLKTVNESVTASLIGSQTGIKTAKALQILDTDVVFQDDSGCGFNSDGATALTQRVLTVGAFKVNEALCPKDLEAKWSQLLLSPGCNYNEGDIPAAYTEKKMSLIQEALETADWKGDILSGDAQLNKYDGFIKIVDAGAEVIDGNPTLIAAITEANIISILQGIYKLIPTADVMKAGMTIWMGQDTYRLYVCALINANLFHYAADGVSTLHGTNITVQPVPGLNGSNRIFAIDKDNMFIGHDLESDDDAFSLMEAKEAEQVRFKFCTKRGVQIAFTNVVEFTEQP